MRPSNNSTKIKRAYLRLFAFTVVSLVSSFSLLAQDYQWAIAPNKDTSYTASSSGEGHDIIVDGSGNVITTGHFTGKLDFNPSSDTAYLIDDKDFYDIFIAKYDSSGNYLWAYSFGNILTDFGEALTTDTEDNVYLSGGYGDKVDFDPSPDTMFLDQGYGFMAKYSASGDYIWAKATGGTGLDILHTGDGSIISSGIYFGKTDFDPSQDSLYLLNGGGFISKYDTSGNLLWARAIEGIVECNGIVEDDAGNLYVSGSFEGIADFDPSPAIVNLTSSGTRDAFIAKYDVGGNYVWAYKIGGTKWTESVAIAVDNSGNIYITGDFNDSVDFDVSGSTATLNGGLWGDIFLAKYDSDGNYIWAHNTGGTNGDRGNDLEVGSSGSVYVTGYFQDSVDFDPALGVANLTSVGYKDIFVSKYDLNGNYLWAMGLGDSLGGTGDIGNALAVGNTGNVCVTGVISGSIDFDPAASLKILDGSIFFAKYSAGVVGLEEFGKNEVFTIYPNPGSGVFKIDIGQLISRSGLDHHVFVYNVMGEVVFDSPVNSEYLQIDISASPSGLYLIEIVDDNHTYSGKIVRH